ncbi:MAG: hypothetical protein CFH35_01844 [Alphaproteobacteria bacterium MarineAlpha9_Bin5]|nr:MAG: hypothetical protein CFH36_01159 [Alphaproteobacteria bacterium MarineAlpha9_Bin6]PPR35883.1 MAG: hypothetical protein CFH35_01844 [Alphaproteobacteria bacterium MarineAlpha9_Bin5]
MIDRLKIDSSEYPNFMGCWMFQDKSVCDDLIKFFEDNEESQTEAWTSLHKVQETVKKSRDISIAPLDLKEEKFHPFLKFIDHLQCCHLDYLEQWDLLKSFYPILHIGPFNLRRYDTGGHFGAVHSERTSLNVLHRVLAWMTYLNDVPEGGETEFPLFRLKVKPEKGKTLIWPAEWTHAHRGSIVKKGPKYITTGWLHLPDDI